jgi:ribosomal 30S subunit maturation factor RimM
MSYTSARRSVEADESYEAPQDYAGYEVLDPEGRKVGKVKELFVNWDGEPEYVRVRIGSLGLRSNLIPVQSVALDHERRALVLE